jgi:hypothetical protein
MKIKEKLIPTLDVIVNRYRCFFIVLNNHPRHHMYEWLHKKLATIVVDVSFLPLEGLAFSLFFGTSCASFGLSLTFPFCLPCDGFGH